MFKFNKKVFTKRRSIMKNDKKFTIMAILFAVSLVCNAYFLTNMTKADDAETHRIIERYVQENPEKEDDTLIKATLEKFAKDEKHSVLTQDGQDVTKQHEDKLLEFNKNHDYKAAKEYVLKENISIGYSDDNIK